MKLCVKEVEVAGGRRIDRCITASVVPDATKRWKRVLESTCASVLWVSHTTTIGLDLAVPKPETIGADRKVYSDESSTAHLRQLRRRINREFYTPGHILHVLKKGLRNKIVPPKALVTLPAFGIYKTLQHSLRKMLA